MLRRGWILFLWLGLVGVTMAQPAATGNGFAETFTPLPVADRADLAARFYGVDPAATPVTANAAPPRVGDVEVFGVDNTQRNQRQQVRATLRAMGDHLYVWVDESVSLTDATITAFVQGFDAQVYDATRALWGSEPSPGIDGDTRLHMLITDDISPAVGGYYADANRYPQAIVPGSNEREMFVFQARSFQAARADQLSIAAHEFQHMIRSSVDPNEQGWVDEGFSMLTENRLGIADNRRELRAFFLAPGTSLTAWGLTDDADADYGASLAFMTYIADRYDDAALRALSDEPHDGMAGVAAALASFGVADTATLIADWAAANALRLPDSPYGYRTLPPNLVPVASEQTMTAYPQMAQRMLRPYGTHYYTLRNLPADGLRLALDIPATTRLMPVDMPADNIVWYSQRGDMSNPRLTRSFDLREVVPDDDVTLEYRIWYDLETHWDYAYISISRDSGATWALQSTDHTTTANPNRRAYGVGYTGQSDGWQFETISLADYAGEQIQVRFEMVTDDAYNQPGVAIDDIMIPALDYVHRANTAGNWRAEGFIRTDNRVPLRTWVQALQPGMGGGVRHRWLADGSAVWTVTPADVTSPLMIAITPLAPLTTEATNYALRLSPVDEPVP